MFVLVDLFKKMFPATMLENQFCNFASLRATQLLAGYLSFFMKRSEKPKTILAFKLLHNIKFAKQKCFAS